MGMRFDSAISARHPGLKTHPFVRHNPLNTREALYEDRREAKSFQYNIREEEKIRYLEVTNLYQYIWKYFKFPLGNPNFHVGDMCRDKDATLCKEKQVKRSILSPKDSFISY